MEQLAAWKFLMFSGSFTTRLYVFQDKPQGVVRESSHTSQPYKQRAFEQQALFNRST